MNGVTYFKATLRPHFVKGVQSVFLWRFFQIFRFNRGHQDMIKWIGKFAVQRKRVQESWMDLCDLYDLTAPVVQQEIARRQILACSEPSAAI